MKSFLEYVIEDNQKVNEAGATSDPKTNDCHEILTAYLCTRRLDYLKQIATLKGNDNILKELQAIYDDIKANQNKIVGAKDVDIESIIQYGKKEEAFAQAISAAIAILEQNNLNEASRKKLKEVERPISEMSEGVEKVILTGNSWDQSVAHFSGIEALKKFDVNSYGMKDFNSSDIILVGKKNFLGVSLKKTGTTKSQKDPPLINRSFNETLPESANDAVNKALDDCFNEIIKTKKLILTDDILPAILKKLPSMLTKNGSVKENYSTFISGSQVKEILDSDNPEKALEEFLKDKCEKCSGSMWRMLLSSSFGLMCTHNSRVAIRNVINPILSNPKSKYKDAITKVLKDKCIAESIAYQLFGIIFKADAEHGLLNLKKYNFDFGLCTGKGSYKKAGQGALNVGKAEYESIETVTKILSDLRKSGKPVLDPDMGNEDAIYSDKEDNTTVSLFYILKIGDFPIANIIIRYKGIYTSAPTFLATMTPELKQKFLGVH